MTHQNTITIIADIGTGMMKALRKVLADIKEELILKKYVDFEALGTIHYCRWIILEAVEINGQHYIPRLAFSSNFDGDPNKHIFDFCSGNLAGFIDKIYTYCDGYPDVPSRNTAARINFFNARMVQPLSFYEGAPGRSVTQIMQESNLRNHIRMFIDNGAWQNASATQVHLEIKKAITANPDFDWLKNTVQLPAKNWPALILLGALLLVLSPFIIIWMLILQIFYENRDIPLGLSPSQVDPALIARLEEYEDLQFQNQFSQMLEMKPGMVRLLTLKAFMLLQGALVKFLFVENNLMGIPTIHFAKWLMIDNNKRMLFVSNFDGSWQQYLGDFIDKSGWGLTAIWNNTMGFPKTKFLFFDGAYDAEHFLAWSRYYQIPTQVWYSAYPNLSIKNIVNNSHIRVNLLNNLDEFQATQFLQRI